MNTSTPHSFRVTRYLAAAFAFAGFATLAACAAGNHETGDTSGAGSHAGQSSSSAGPVTCPDADGDGISDEDEGANENPPRDTDGDGIPDYLDKDSDGDGIPDSVEGGTHGDPCKKPVDSDGDGVPDFRDLDSDSPTNSTVPDAEERGPDGEHPRDTDGDGRPDYLDPDNDGDGIPDEVELTPLGATKAVTKLALAPDTDGDGIPDFLDTDSDGDGIPDAIEGTVDTDGDGIPNYRDLDSDGDCIPDAIEGLADSDGDGTPDYLTLDSDGDGVSDSDEDPNCNGVVDPCETDRTKADTDGDGVSDLIERTACAIRPAAEQLALDCACDGADPSVSPTTRGQFVFTSPFKAAPIPMSRTLALGTDVSRADVVFALDTTASMQGSLDNLETTLSTSILPAVKAKVSDVAFGVLDFKDFGDPYVVRYDHRIQTVRTSAGAATLQQTLGSLLASGGNDGPEAGWELLYAIAGGPAISVAGYSSALPLDTTFPVSPSPGEEQGTLYGAGFRAAAVPIVITVTDAEWHDAPGVAYSGEDGHYDYTNPYQPQPSGPSFNVFGVPSRAVAMQQIISVGAHVVALNGVGFSTTGSPKDRGTAVASATGAVVSPADFGDSTTRPAGCPPDQCCTGAAGAGEPADATGSCPLSYSFDGNTGGGVGDAVVSGIVTLARSLRFDAHVQASDVDPGTVDGFLDRLVPNVSGMGDASMCVVIPESALADLFTGPRALPGADGTLDTFPGVGGGVPICFDVVAKTNTTVAQTAVPQVFKARLEVQGVADGTTFLLGTPRDVLFLVPPVIPMPGQIH